MYLSLQTAMNVHMEKKKQKNNFDIPIPSKSVHAHHSADYWRLFIFPNTPILFFFFFVGKKERWELNGL